MAKPFITNGPSNSSDDVSEAQRNLEQQRRYLGIPSPLEQARVGEIPPPIVINQEASARPPLTKTNPPERQQELFDLHDFYNGDAWREQELLFLSQALLGGMPYKRTNERTYTRTFTTSKGPVTITLTAIGKDFNGNDIPLPFGKDRVVLACALTKARQKARPLVYFHELLDLLATFGEKYHNSGGRNYELSVQRWERLNNCAITIRRGNSPASNKEGKNRFLISDYKLPPRRRGPRSKVSPSVTSNDDQIYGVKFGAEFWQDYLNFCIPMPVPLMRLFADQPMAWDICLLVHWASYSAIQSKRRGGTGQRKFSMQELIKMLGTSDSNPRRLRDIIKQVLSEIRVVWPQVNVDFDDKVQLIIAPPKDDRLLVQVNAQAQQIHALIEDSARQAAGESVDPSAWIAQHPALYRRFVRELKLLSEASAGATNPPDARYKSLIAAERSGIPVQIAAYLTDFELK
jgi:hypothetical protein